MHHHDGWTKEYEGLVKHFLPYVIIAGQFLYAFLFVVCRKDVCIGICIKIMHHHEKWNEVYES